MQNPPCEQLAQPQRQSQRLLEFDQVTLGYGQTPAVKQLNGQLHAGEMLALVGPNGSGKSTLLKAITQPELVQAGRLNFSLKLTETAILSQISSVERDFPLTVGAFVQTGLWRCTGLFQRIDKTSKQRCQDVLEQVGIADLANSHIGNLSGGQFQRMRFARLLLQDARLLLLDEPFAGVDESTIQALSELMLKLNEQGTAIIAVLHDQQWVAKLFPTTCLLAGQQIAWGATTDVFTHKNWLKAYGCPACHD